MRIRRRLAASCEEVFDAWLDAEAMQEWMRPGPVTRCQVMLDPRVGGTFRILMDAHDTQIVNTGEFLVLQRPATLQFTWVSSRWEYQETLITVELYPHGADCELVLTHERFPADNSAEQLMTGWTQMLERLGRQFSFRVDR